MNYTLLKHVSICLIEALYYLAYMFGLKLLLSCKGSDNYIMQFILCNLQNLANSEQDL